MEEIVRADTFEHLQGLCAGKGIICERRGRRIELTTPCGGTTAECSSIGEALDTYRNDPTFSDLPIQFRAQPEVKRTPSDVAPVVSSRATAAVRKLKQSWAGKKALENLSQLVNDAWSREATQVEWFEIQTLVNEAAAGRIDWIHRINE